MEIIRMHETYRVSATGRQIVLSVFFAALCGGLCLSVATGILFHQFIGLNAYQTAENRASLTRAQVELRNLALEVTTCERRITSCLRWRQ